MVPQILDLRAGLVARGRVGLADLPERHEIARDERQLRHRVMGPWDVPEDRRCAVRQT